jgi:hypothetical protein
MNCRSAESLFSSYIEDEISQEERRNVESHLMGCRRCSLAMREVRATMTMLTRIPEVEVQPSAHFDEDVYARIRSGEGLRPTAVEWLRELLVPARLRPVFMAGAGVCAVAIATIVSPIGQGFLHPAAVNPSITARPEATATESSPRGAAPGSAVTTPSTLVPTTSAPGPAPRERTSSVIAAASRRNPVAGDSIVDGRIDRPRYDDQIINDTFYLERGSQGQNPAIVPVHETQGDGVYVIF